MRGKENIIFGYIILFLFVSQITAMGAPTIFEDVVEEPHELVPDPPERLFSFQTIAYIGGTMTIFFQLMSVGTEWAILSAVLVVPFVIFVLWVVLRMLMEIIGAIIPG